VTNGKVVVAHYGNGDLAAYDVYGSQLWKRNLPTDFGRYTIWYGHSNSPVLYEDLVISICLQDAMADQQEKPAESYVVAHELMTGKMRWKSLRMTGAPAEEAEAYTTPLLLTNITPPQLIVMGGNQLDAYDPRTGRQLWLLKGLVGGRTITSPTISEGLLFATRGKRGELFAFPLPNAPVSPASMEREKREILWSDAQGTPDCCSVVADSRLLFTVTDDGVARCYDLKTGKLKWKERMPGEYKASPVMVQGRVLFLNTSGLCTIVSASSKFDKLAQNQLDDETLASPAIANEHLYLRGKKALYCFGQRFR
jgi:outer membrane protein assembly factor BamB